MRGNFLAVIASALSLAAPAASFAASPPILFLPGQTIFACPKKTSPPTAGVVCTQNVLVGGGQPLSGYTFSVKSGTTLPPGIFLMPLTGILTATNSNPALPPAGQSKKIQITASDGSKSASGTVTLVMQNSSVCGCAIFSGGTAILPPARANRPYALTLAVFGPNSYRVLRPNYTWKLATGSKLPPGLVIDQARGVLRGTPLSSAIGKTYNFYVNITENITKQKAYVPGPYILHVVP
jgi:hypothetical protein